MNTNKSTENLILLQCYNVTIKNGKILMSCQKKKKRLLFVTAATKRILNK